MTVSSRDSFLMTRRRVLGIAFGAGAATLLMSCAPAALPTPAAPPPAPTTAPPSAPTQAPAPKPQPTTAAAATAKPLEKASLRFSWLVTGYYSPFYVSMDKGWYRDAGLDVAIGDGKGSGSTIQLIATGADTFGLSDAGVMTQMVGQNAPVIMVANVFPKGSTALVVRGDSDIKTLKDLEGKTFGDAPSATAYQLLPSLLSVNGVDPNKVTMISVDTSSKTQAWLAGKFDVMSATLNDEVPNLKAQGIQFRTFAYGEFGLATLGLGLVVNTKTVQEKPGLVKSFVSASLKGWQYAFEHPEEAAQTVSRMVPDAKINPAIATDQIKASLPLTQTDNTKGKPLGWMAEKDWQNTIDLLSKYSTLKEKPPIEKLYTNQFIPGS